MRTIKKKMIELIKSIIDVLKKGNVSEAITMLKEMHNYHIVIKLTDEQINNKIDCGMSRIDCSECSCDKNINICTHKRGDNNNV